MTSLAVSLAASCRECYHFVHNVFIIMIWCFGERQIGLRRHFAAFQPLTCRLHVDTRFKTAVVTPSVLIKQTLLDFSLIFFQRNKFTKKTCCMYRVNEYTDQFMPIWTLLTHEIHKDFMKGFSIHSTRFFNL